MVLTASGRIIKVNGALGGMDVTLMPLGWRASVWQHRKSGSEPVSTFRINHA
jgi:hypothetical protein